MALVISAEARKDLLELVTEWAQRHIDVGSLEEAEQIAEEARQTVGQIVLEAALVASTGKSTYKGTTWPCSCGQKARFVGYRRRWIRSLCGETRVERAYYHCSACKRGISPWDGAQGLTDRIYSPRLKALIGRVMGRLPYSEGVEMLAEMAAVTLEESSAEAVMLEVGQRLREEEAHKTEHVQALAKQALAERLMCGSETDVRIASMPVREVTGDRLYVGVDATTAHIDGSWHNVQNGIVFTVVQDPQKGRDTLSERSYVAAQTDMEHFGWMVRTRAEEWNLPKYKQVVALGDGAPCNWNLFRTHFPRAVQILDFWHLSEHLWALSRALYAQENEKQKAAGDRWVKARLDSLQEVGPAPLLRALRRRKAHTDAQKEALRLTCHYVQTNACRMHYDKYLAAGMMIGSGPVEAACKVVVERRLKQAGMRWSQKGADAVLAVRAALLNRDHALLDQCAKAA